MALVVRLTAVVVDHERESATVTGYITYDGQAAIGDVLTRANDWGVLVQTMTDGRVQSVSLSVTDWVDFGLPGSGGAYSTTEDKLFLEFRNLVDGKASTYQLPAPKSTLVTADTETADPADGIVAGFINSVEADYVNSNGDGTLKYILGYRRRNRSKSEKPGIASATG